MVAKEYAVIQVESLRILNVKEAPARAERIETMICIISQSKSTELGFIGCKLYSTSGI